MSPTPPIQKVLIVGAGISGLTAALSFRKCGITVEILEKAPVLSEVGAAISLAPNCTRILLSFGFSATKARCTDVGPQLEYNAAGTIVDYFDLRTLRDAAGWPWWWVHRADLHGELLRLVTSPSPSTTSTTSSTSITTSTPTSTTSEWGPPARIELGCEVIAVHPEEGVVETRGGPRRRWQADLIVGADGVRSTVRPAVTGRKEEKSVYSGHSAFRALFDIEAMKKDPELAPFVDMPKMQNWVAMDGRRALMYPCRNNTLLNLFAPIPMPASDSVESWRAVGKTEDLVAAFASFPAPLQKLFSTAPKHPPLWQIRDRDPVRGWSRGRCILIGDAAHAMLPHQGQGGAQSIEDAGALPVFVLEPTADDNNKTWSLQRRLQAFEEFRFPRVKTVVERSRQQKEPPHERPGKLPSLEMRSMGKMQVDYDVVKEAREWLKRNRDGGDQGESARL